MTKTTTQPQAVYLKDYQPSSFFIDRAYLHFDLMTEQTEVTSTLHIRRNSAMPAVEDLVLDGQQMELVGVKCDGVELTTQQCKVDDHSLTIAKVSDAFCLEIKVIIKPHENVALTGLYQSKGNYCTQCESHGFRRITYFLDRPDVLCCFTVCITADAQRYPVMLSNGNLIEEKELENGRRWVKWEDPTLKPAYLFALVAGDYEFIEETFKTASGHSVKLQVYVEQGMLDQSQHAMDSLKRAMKWDEEAFGREYELDMYMIVAVSDFNMGAMENKGLNVFNDRFILAKPETATDRDYINIESVIGHEYFHNWSGNRVTVANWFQITLKEGLTIFREQSFNQAMHSATTERIRQVNIIRTVQFAQDSGPMAHPVQPDHYIEMNNFYTVTVYNKGAEVIRMMHTLLGQKKFRQAMDLYFSQHDGSAVTTEEFVKAMEDASGMDLKQFRRWYSQAGTPTLAISGDYNPDQQRYTLNVQQTCPATPGQEKKEPFHIPLAMGLLDNQGNDIELKDPDSGDRKKTVILNIKNSSEKFIFEDIAVKPLPSLLRQFSAPVKIEFDYSNEDLIFLMSQDSDEFNRWDAGQQFAVRLILELIQSYQAGETLTLDPAFIESFKACLTDSAIDHTIRAEMLTLPSIGLLIQEMEAADAIALFDVRTFVRRALAKALKTEFMELYQQTHHQDAYEITEEAIGKRDIKNCCLNYLMALEDDQEIMTLVKNQFDQSNNMTDRMGALVAINDTNNETRTHCLDQFYETFKDDSLVMDKWLSLQAISAIPGTLSKVIELQKHASYDAGNPNKVRALIGAFVSQNVLNFHHEDGSGYRFLADTILEIDPKNPQLAARLIEPLTKWQQLNERSQTQMLTELHRIAKAPKLSNDLYEIVTRTLPGEKYK